MEMLLVEKYRKEAESLRTQLAKANERLEESEQVRTEYSFLIADLVRRADVKNDLYKNPTYKKAIDQLNKFAIEKKIEAIENFVLPYKQGVTKEYVKGGYGSLVLKAAQAEIEQLRKEQDKC